MSEEYEEEVIENDASYSLKSPFLKGEIAKDHVNRCLINRSKEMKSGYFNTSKSNSGEEVKEYIGDTRKGFISSVKALYSLLYPELIVDEKVNESIKKLDTAEKKLFNELAYNEVEVVNGSLKETGVKYIPEYDDIIKHIGIAANGVKVIKNTKGIWNKRVSFYWESLVDLYDKRFQQLNQLIDNLDYFNPEAAGY